jgi:RecB family endonuclease NucS
VDYIAADPVLALREAGLETLAVAQELPAGDSADLVLEDRDGTVVAVQVGAEEDRLATIAHASMRRAMLELEMGRRRGRSRVFVVAFAVSREMRELCASYGIECFAVDEELVRSWEGHRTGAGPGD